MQIIVWYEGCEIQVLKENQAKEEIVRKKHCTREETFPSGDEHMR